MQRFSCPPDKIDKVIQAGGCDEAFTHATRPEHARRLVELCGGRGMRLHAASSALLDCPEARLDAVRPGLALYRDAVRITTRLLDARDSHGPIGYGGFTTTTGRHGVIAGGYTTGVKPGICVINGQRRRIIECGMQSSFVEIDAKDRAGDEVVLLGDELPLEDVAREWKTAPHETLWRMSSGSYRIFD
jgi:alanine racemase